MAKKVTLTITVNDDKAPNDLGIGIIAERNCRPVGYSDLTANELEKLSIVFNTLVLHKEDNMNKEEIRRAKHILRRGTIKDAYDESEDNTDTDIDTNKDTESLMKEMLNELAPNTQRIAYISIGYAKMGKLIPYHFRPYHRSFDFTKAEADIIEYFVKSAFTKAKTKNKNSCIGFILVNEEPGFDSNGFFIWHNDHVINHIKSQIEQDMFFHELIGRDIDFTVVGNNVFIAPFVWSDALKRKIIEDYEFFDEEIFSDFHVLHWKNSNKNEKIILMD